MKTGWKITIEACALDPRQAKQKAQSALHLCQAWIDEPKDSSVSGLNGSASAKWEQIELPDVNEGENL